MRLKKTIFLLFILFAIIFVDNSVEVRAVSGTPIEDGGSYTYQIDVENPKSIEEIISDINLTAFDDYDGDITDKIYYEDVDDYMETVYDQQIERRNVDEYLINFFVSDTSGNEAMFSLVLVVQDITAPYLLGSSKSYYEIDIDDIQLTDEDIIEGIVAYDDYCGPYYETEIINGSMKDLEMVIDEEQLINVKISDEYGNELITTVTIVLKDYTPPLILADSYIITTSYEAKAPLEDLLYTINIKVTDNYDNNLIFKIASENYSSSEYKVGEYIVTLEAEDRSGNKSGCEIKIEIIDNIPPVFYIDTSKLYVSANTLLTKDDFISLIKSENKIKNEEYEFFLLEDTYTSNYDEEGTHLYSFKLAYKNNYTEQYDFDVNVMSFTQPTLTFMQIFLNANKKIGLLIWDILRWPISKFKELI